jgi:hypothetical protein
MGDTGRMYWTDGRGREVERPVNYILDIRKHVGEPGWALLAVAANTHLSIADLERLLATEGVYRSRSWIQRRRWLFQQADAVNNQGRPNADGKDEKAKRIMEEYSSSSARQLVRILAENGIVRGRDWVWRNRVVRTSPI